MLSTARTQYPATGQRAWSGWKPASGGLRGTSTTRLRKRPCGTKDFASHGWEPRWGAALSQTNLEKYGYDNSWSTWNSRNWSNFRQVSMTDKVGNLAVSAFTAMKPISASAGIELPVAASVTIEVLGLVGVGTLVYDLGAYTGSVLKTTNDSIWWSLGVR